MLVEDQSPNLNALSGREVIVGPAVDKCRVRHPPGAPVGLGVEALDQDDLLWRNAVLEIPLVFLIREHSICPTVAIGIDESEGDQVLLGHRIGFGQGQRVAENLLDGAPDVDDLDAALEELGCFLRQMVRDSGQGRLVRLVDVDVLDRASQLCGRSRLVLAQIRTTDRVVEDEDSGSSSSGKCLSIQCAETWYTMRNSAAYASFSNCSVSL